MLLEGEGDHLIKRIRSTPCWGWVLVCNEGITPFPDFQVTGVVVAVQPGESDPELDAAAEYPVDPKLMEWGRRTFSDADAYVRSHAPTFELYDHQAARQEFERIREKYMSG